MASRHAAGKKALESKDYATAIKEFTAAIKEHPQSPIYYEDRSAAWQRSGDLPRALLDAEAAVFLAKNRDRAQLIGKAQLRRGIVLFHLGQYQDASKCFVWSKEKEPGNKMIGIWEAKLKEKIDAGAGPGASVVQIPDESVVNLASGGKEEDEEDKDNSVKKQIEPAPVKPAAIVPTGVTTAPSQIKHDFYQDNKTVTISLMVKGVPKDKAVIEIEKGSVAITFPLPTGSDYNFSLDPLFAAINPEESSYKVMSTKIEMVLKKVEPGLKWKSLEGTAPVGDVEQDSKPETIPEAVVKGPSYPTSSKSGPKDWDKVASNEIKKMKKSDNKDKKEKAESTERDDDFEDEGDPVNGFFKRLFKDADPDTRRAMMKSYTESNGTALSTNWSEVGKKTVETHPPDGMEAKKWE